MPRKRRFHDSRHPRPPADPQQVDTKPDEPQKEKRSADLDAVTPVRTRADVTTAIEDAGTSSTSTDRA